MEDSVDEPENPSFKKARAPTIDVKDGEFIPVKHNFGEKFVRPIFTGEQKEVLFNRRGKPLKDKHGHRQFQTTARKKGMIDPAVKKKYQLNEHSRPEEFVEMLLPRKPNKIGNTEHISFSQIAHWTDLKATHANAGKGGVYYQDYEPFDVDEIKQHFGLYIINGLVPSPWVEYKFQPQSKDKIHGNDHIYCSFGSNAVHCHTHFKAFLVLQNLAIPPQNGSKVP